ncbi:MAG TPA: hypothetical protein VM370_09885 [Candidatus Thermoplasmatota archaeon]|nr:hypothetical protein [Candidatus Thermoplasmatota archaeon]
MADADRPFVVDVRRRWTLLILPILAALYFIAVLVLIVGNYRVQGVSNELLALVGVGIFVLVMLIELPFLLRRGAPRASRPAPAPLHDAPMRTPGPRIDDEYMITEESQQGLRVVEYSAPAKSRNSNIVYTKTYVPVTGAHVLRVETAVADGSDL